MNKILTNRQIAFMIYATTIGYGVINIPKTAVEGGGTGGWVSLLIAAIIFMLFTYIITYLQYVYENKTLYEYSGPLVGKLITYIFLIICILYFFTFFSMIARIYAETFRLIFLNKTPVVYICILFYIVVFYALKKGIVIIGRVCEIYAFLNIIGFTFINFLLCTKGTLLNIQPLFVKEDIITYIKGVTKLILPFLGVEIILFLPISRTNNKNIFKYTTLMVGFIGIFYIYIAEATISVVGIDSVVNLSAVSFSVLRGIDIYHLEFFRRIDGAYILFWTMNIFCEVCLWGYGTISFTKKIIKNSKHRYTASIITFISFIAAIIPKTKEQVESVIKYNSYLGIIVSLIIPGILFIVTKVKKYDKQI